MTNCDTSHRIRRMPTREGLRWRGRRYGSAALASLRRRLPPGALLTVRVDCRDGTYALVLDEGRGTWIRADLMSPATSGAG